MQAKFTNKEKLSRNHKCNLVVAWNDHIDILNRGIDVAERDD